MNNLSGKIKHIKNSEYLSEVIIELENNSIFNVFLVETPQSASYLKPGQKIQLLFNTMGIGSLRVDPEQRTGSGSK